ncbi:putative late promoter transcription accessory protein [Klebsiella phage vB_KaeM_KaAlpha]|uniref:Late transcription coactivator n=5 Tax=Karamvirus TaxID=1913650 RepID=A0A5B9NP77_9CAUD|nr:putative late promoter transcription accessory protein [Klebsiella phage vB_KaeM_KaAlpha]
MKPKLKRRLSCMTLFSLNDETPAEKPDSVTTLVDKQNNGFAIEALVNEHGMSYLEAATHWLEENSFPETAFAKYIPGNIIEKIMSEALDDNLLRPSFSKQQKTNTLDFLL